MSRTKSGLMNSKHLQQSSMQSVTLTAVDRDCDINIIWYTPNKPRHDPSVPSLVHLFTLGFTRATLC